MIEVLSNIGDPVKFVAANTDIVDSAIDDSKKRTYETTGTNFVIGDDFEVEVAYIPPEFLPSIDNESLELLEEGSVDGLEGIDIASSLGSLYQYLSGSFLHGRHRIYITAYPSANRVNLLSTALGNSPGEDVPAAHTVANRGEIKRREFVDLLSQKKHPRGVKGPRRAPGVGIFHHDRNSDHTPGSLWIPPKIAQAVFDRAEDVASGYKPKLLDRDKAQLTTEYDNLTMRLSGLASLMMNESVSDSSRDRGIEDIVSTVTIMSIGEYMSVGQSEMRDYLNGHFNKMKRNTLTLKALGFSAFKMPVA